MYDESPDHNVIIKEYPNMNIPLVHLNNNPSRRFFRHWEVKMLFPTMVVILVISGVTIYFLSVHNYIQSSNWKFFCFFNLLISLFLFLWSYFAAVCMDPGFLPYDWINTKRTKYSWEEQLEGLAINREQIQFATTHSRPLGSCFSQSYGRFVLRPDHICGWISNWVGKRNHKQFILMLIYGAYFATSLAFPRLLIKYPSQRISAHLEFLGQLAAVIEIIFIVALSSGFISKICDLKINFTTLDKMKKKSQRNFNENSSIKYENGFDEVCGNGSKCCWMLPTPAFGNNIPFDVEEPKKPVEIIQQFPQFEFQNVPILDSDDFL